MTWKFVNHPLINFIPPLSITRITHLRYNKPSHHGNIEKRKQQCDRVLLLERRGHWIEGEKMEMEKEDVKMGGGGSIGSGGGGR